METCKGSVSCLNMKDDLSVSTAVHCGRFYNCWSTEWAWSWLYSRRWSLCEGIVDTALSILYQKTLNMSSQMCRSILFILVHYYVLFIMFYFADTCIAERWSKIVFQMCFS